MNIDWDNAPDWANFLTWDCDGRCFWHETEPKLLWEHGSEPYFLNFGGRYLKAEFKFNIDEKNFDWLKAIARRP